MTLPEKIRELLTIDEVAARLRLRVDQVQRLVDTGQLTKLVVCGEIRFDSADVANLIATYRAVAERRDQ